VLPHIDKKCMLFSEKRGVILGFLLSLQLEINSERAASVGTKHL